MKRIFLAAFAFLIFLSCEKEKEPQKEPITLSAQITNVSVYGESDGSVILTVSGGKEPYSFRWSNGTENKDLIDVPIGEYEVVVTDTDGDTASLSAVIEGPSELMVGYTSQDASGLTSANGKIFLEISGGVLPYTISWSGGETNDTLTGLLPGSYTATVTDANGAEKTVEIEIYSPVKITLTKTNVTASGASDGTIVLTFAGGKEPFEILWKDGNTGNPRSELHPGFYEVTVTDANGKQSRASCTIYEPYPTDQPMSELINKITRLQNSGIRIEQDGKMIYIDPVNVLENHLNDADIILITHAHGDHFKTDILQKLIKSSTTILVPEECYNPAVTLAGADHVVKVAPDSVKTVEGITIEVVEAYNSNHFLPNSVGYILTLDGKRVYHAGDTRRIPEMTGFNADIAFLPLGQTYTMASLNEAADAAEDLGADIVIPIHYGINEGTWNDPFQFKQMLEGEIEVCIKESF